jgi:uncharacterized membrane protein YphA (DoxX/SURF4 family)
MTNQRSTMTYVLWTVQVLLALLFLFAGAMKLILPVEAMTRQMPLPALLLRFIGVAEVMGAAGLILPGLLRVRTGLTPLAAAGLAIIMIGATALTVSAVPAVVGLLAGFVIWGRTVPANRISNISGRSLLCN